MSQEEQNIRGQYGNLLIDSRERALKRGSGNWNPPPLYNQTTDRGNAGKNSLEIYQEEKQNLPQDLKYDNREFSQKEYKIVNNPQQYVVGVSGIYHQPEKPWTRENINNNGDEYTNYAIKSTHFEPNVLLNYFFSKININYIQNRIIEEAKRIQGVDISTQSEDELLQIMRFMYLEALNGWLPQNNEPDRAHRRGEAPCSLKEMLTRLNKSVIELCVQQVLSGIKMMQTYYQDASSLPLPLEHPRYVSMSGSRVLSENVGLYSSHQFTRDIQSYNERYNIL